MYGSHAAADTFATSRGLTGWPAVEADGDALLLRASEALDATYGFKGVKADSDQVRCWPRLSVFDEDGYEVSSATVPTRIEQATYRLALLFVANATNLTFVDAAQPIESVKAGSVAVTYKDGAKTVTARSLARHMEVSGYLRGLTTGSVNNVALRCV